MRRILVIDHQSEIVTKLESQLYAKGFEVIVTSHGKQAIRDARQMQPALILVDIDLYKMNGVETLRRLKGHRSTQSVPVIFLTDEEFTEDCHEGLRWSAEMYLRKPIQTEELWNAIEELLKRSEISV